MATTLSQELPDSTKGARMSDNCSAQSLIEALNRVLRSGQFDKSERASQFLRYIVEESIAGRADRIKGYSIATDVFGRGADFDTDNDTIVRVQAGQIRRRLSLYYADDGRHDPIRIELPKGSYVPIFLRQSPVDDAARASDGKPVAGLTLPRGPAIAVLPFNNLSANQSHDYLADGIAEELINDLTKFRDLLVVARSTAFCYRENSEAMGNLAEELGVEYILIGSVRSADTKIRISVQLIDASNNINVFSDQYDRELSPNNLLDLQEEIANAVVAKVAEPYGVIARLGQHRVRRSHTDSIDSYGCVLRYYQFEAEPTLEEHARLRDLLEQATVEDPDYASTWAALSAIYIDEVRLRMNPRPAREAIPLALEAAQRAVSLDPQNSMAQHFLFCAHFYAGNRREFYEAGDRALQLNPNHPDMLADYALYRIYNGDWDGGMPLARKAVAISVFPPGWYYMAFCINHYRLGRYTDALEAALKVKTPSVYQDHLWRSICHAQLGNEGEARACLIEIDRLYPQFRDHATRIFTERHFEPALINSIVEGLKKAGMTL